MKKQGLFRAASSTALIASVMIMSTGCGASAAVRPAPVVHYATYHNQAFSIAQAKAVEMVNATTGWAYSSKHVYRTVRSGHEWSRVLSTNTIIDMDAVNNKTDWIAEQKGPHEVGLCYTTNGGLNWRTDNITTRWPVTRASISITTSSGGSVGSVLLSGPVGAQTGPQAIWLITNSEVSSYPVYQTPNGNFTGISWTSPNHAWASSGGTRLGVSQNGGRDWQAVTLPFPSFVPGKAITDPKPQLRASIVASRPPMFAGLTGYLSATLYVPYTTSKDTVKTHYYAVLYRTTNNKTWAPIWSQRSGSISAMDWVGQNGWLIVEAGHTSWLQHTSTRGRTWNQVSVLPFTMGPLSVGFAGRTGWIVSQGAESNTLSLFHSLDSGQKWQAVY